MDEKIKISAPQSLFELLKKDCEDFKIGNSTRNIKINKKLKQAGFGKVKIGRDGIGAVLNEISNSPIHGAINGIFSNTLSYGISLFREIF